MKKRRAPRTLKDKFDSAKYFSYFALDAVEDALAILEEIKAGKDPGAIEVPKSISEPDPTPNITSPHRGFEPKHWDAIAIKLKMARRFFGSLQSHCRQLARAGYEKARPKYTPPSE